MITSARFRKSADAADALDRPFDKLILTQARAVADQYGIILEFKDGHWFGCGLELPTVFGDGKTPQAAVADTREALVTGVACLLEKGRTPPASAREGHRSVQVNIRLTHEEKAMLESRAKAKGFRGLSDFIRATALAEK